MVVGSGVKFEAREYTFSIFEINLLITLDSDFEEMECFHWADCGFDNLYFALRYGMRMYIDLAGRGNLFFGYGISDLEWDRI